MEQKIQMIKKSVKRIKPIYFLWEKVNQCVEKIKGIYNGIFPKRLYNLDFRRKNNHRLQKHALLSYIVHPFSISRDNPRFYRHINIWRVPEIVKILNDIGYLVDVVDYTDHKFVPKKKYDLFIGHGGHGDINFINIASCLSSQTTKIFFSTINYWKYYNNAVSGRYAALSKRKKIEIQPKMLFQSAHEVALKNADGVIGIGSDFSRNTYRGFSPFFMVNNTALRDDNTIKINRNFDKGRNNFLFFAGADNVRKGLDLLLESFAGIEHHLWICSFIDRKIKEIYWDELYNSSNIHLIGNIFPRGDMFYELMEKCNFVILPSCSEGQPHSVIECMNYGLIPIVSRACDIDAKGFAEIIEDFSIVGMRKVIEKCAKYSPQQCQEMSGEIINIVKSEFSERSFYENLSRAITFFVN